MEIIISIKISHIPNITLTLKLFICLQQNDVAKVIWKEIHGWIFFINWINVPCWTALKSSLTHVQKSQIKKGKNQYKITSICKLFWCFVWNAMLCYNYTAEPLERTCLAKKVIFIGLQKVPNVEDRVQYQMTCFFSVQPFLTVNVHHWLIIISFCRESNFTK